jgi:hypothetical protein
MATSAMKKVLSFFKGTESKKEEAKEKKLSPAAYKKGEMAEGSKSTSPKTKPVAKKTVAKATTRPAKKK